MAFCGQRTAQAPHEMHFSSTMVTDIWFYVLPNSVFKIIVQYNSVKINRNLPETEFSAGKINIVINIFSDFCGIKL